MDLKQTSNPSLGHDAASNSRTMPAWWRPAIAIPIAASLLCHAGMIIAIERIGFFPKVRSTVAQSGQAGGIETDLTLFTPPPPLVRPSPPSPQPPPVPDPLPPPPAPKVDAPPPESKAAQAEQPPTPPRPVLPQPTLSPDALALWEASKPVASVPLTPKSEPPADLIEQAPSPAPAIDEPEPVAAPTPAPTSVSFAGVEAQAVGEVIYAVDISGAMTTSLPYVKEELIQSISRLSSGQKFQILTFHQPPGASAPVVEAMDSSEVLIAANDANKVRAARWIAALEPSGSSQPLAALRAALASKPDLLFLMTRSIKRSGGTSIWGKGSRETLLELDALNPKTSNGQRTTAIKALQFIDPDPTGMLQAIGNEHGDGPGSYRVITPR